MVPPYQRKLANEGSLGRLFMDILIVLAQILLKHILWERSKAEKEWKEGEYALFRRHLAAPIMASLVCGCV